MNDPDPEVCSTAAICLASVGPSGDQAVCLLTNRLRIANSKSGYARSEEVRQILVGLKFFEARADEAAMSRMWAGIHFRSDDETGLALGRMVAQKVIKRVQQNKQ